MTAPVMAWGQWKTNAEMFADIARLGYLDGRVLDCTYGEGKFWTVFRPRRLVAHDLYTLDGVDARSMQMHRRRSFDTTVIDPPYAFRGRASKTFDSKYGVGKYRSANAVLELYFDIMTECNRILRPAIQVEKSREWYGGYMIVKCQDQVVSGAVRWQVDEITTFATEHLGMVKVDAFTMNSYRPQPEKRKRKCPWCKRVAIVIDSCETCDGTGSIMVKSRQLHARRNGSSLLVFQKRP